MATSVGILAISRCAAVLRVMDVGAVVIEGRERADQARHHGHRVRVAPEAAQEELHLLVDHRVVGDGLDEAVALGLVGQLAIEQQVADLEEVAVRGQLLDGVAAVQQLALVAVDVGDGAVARGRAQEAGVIGELAGLRVELADVDHVRADAALVQGQFHARAAVAERERGFHVGGGHRWGLSSEGVLGVGRHGCAAQLRQHLARFGRVDLARQRLAAEQQVQQVVIGKIHQGHQPRGLPCRDRLLVVSEEAFDEQVVLEQAAPAAPAQFAQTPFVEAPKARSP
jgi:hypothetical protein